MKLATPDAAAARRAWQGLDAVADGVILARDLVNEPPNVLHPEEFARRAKALAKLGREGRSAGRSRDEANTASARSWAWARAATRESQLVVMQWNGARKKGAPVAFVGKGVCFDSGGLSLKPGAGMMGMKGDMGGAAAVTGAMLALATRKARVNAVGVIGLVENMPGGDAIRPDDVLTSLSGQTIEVLNTDAEGRLVLADALTYTQRRFKPQIRHRSGDPDRRDRAGAGLRACRRLFQRRQAGGTSRRMPAAAAANGCGGCRSDPAYDKMIRSKIADMKNIGGANSGSITAAQFLKRFVEDGTAWAHLDIAGVAWQDGEQKPHDPKLGHGLGRQAARPAGARALRSRDRDAVLSSRTPRAGRCACRVWWRNR